jgi:hypothetical protein
MNAKLLIIASILALCMAPMVISEESDGAYQISYEYQDRIIATGSPLDLNVPSIPTSEGYRIAWMYHGEEIDPATFPYEDGGRYVFIAKVVPINPEPEPAPEPTDYTPWIVLGVVVVFVLIIPVAYIYWRR